MSKFILFLALGLILLCIPYHLPSGLTCARSDIILHRFRLPKIKDMCDHSAHTSHPSSDVSLDTILHKNISSMCRRSVLSSGGKREFAFLVGLCGSAMWGKGGSSNITYNLCPSHTAGRQYHHHLCNALNSSIYHGPSRLDQEREQDVGNPFLIVLKSGLLQMVKFGQQIFLSEISLLHCSTCEAHPHVLEIHMPASLFLSVLPKQPSSN